MIYDVVDGWKYDVREWAGPVRVAWDEIIEDG